MIPELTKYCTGIDTIELSIKAAMGDYDSNLKSGFLEKIKLDRSLGFGQFCTLDCIGRYVPMSSIIILVSSI